MRARTILFTVCLGVGAPLGGCSTTQMAGEQLDDASISTRVASRLAADPAIRKYDIDVDTLQRVVTLRGHVENQGQKDRAQAIARDTRGVTSVVNQLRVGTEATIADGNPDTLITMAVKQRLITDDKVRAFNVDVDTDNRVVTLSGIVRNEMAKLEAERIARETDGVRSVVNELQVNTN